MEWYEVATRSLGALSISYGTSRFLIPLMVALAHKLQVIDAPDGKLKNHKNPTPYLGGIAVYVGFITALALFFPVCNNWWFMIVGTTLLVFVGLIDDLIALTPAQKWWGQVVAAICFVRGGFYLKEVFLLSVSPTYAPLILLFVSFGWMLTIINAFNLIDVMDGLATTVALSIAGILLVHALLLHQGTVIMLLSSIVGALIAFFQYNKPEALIYLGDSGSLFLGGLFAIIPFTLPWGTFYSKGFFTPLLIFFIPLVEVLMLMLIRMVQGIPFYFGSPDHFCLYLKKKGWTIREILLFVIFFSLILLLFSIPFALGYLAYELFFAIGIVLIIMWNIIIFAKFSFLRGFIGDKTRLS